MKLLYVAYSASPYGGSEEALGWNLPLAMSQIKGNEVFLITKIEQREAIERYLSRHPNTKLCVQYCDIPSIYKLAFKGYFYPGRQGIWLKNIVPLVHYLDEKNHFDVIHQINPVEFCSLGYYIPTQALTVAGPQGGAEYASKPLSKYLRSVELFELIRRQRNWLTCVSKKYRKTYEAFDIHLFANSETQRYLVDNGIKQACHAIIKTEIGCWSDSWQGYINKEKQSTVHILYAGRLIPRKGVELLVDACAKLKNVCDFELHIVGDGHLRKTLEQKIVKYGLGNVKIIGVVPYDEMAEQYLWADFFVMPSVRETTGTVLAECMQYGLPLITFRQGGACVALDNTVCNYVSVESGLQGLIKAMRQWIEHPELRPSREDVKKVFESLTWEKRAQQYMNLYRKTIERTAIKRGVR